jgi:DNA gyrase/topoisomerase IV subunit A
MVGPGGLISRTTDEKAPRLGGGEATASLVLANSRDTVYLAATNGETAAVPLHTLPEATKPSEGVPFHRVSTLTPSLVLARAFTLAGKKDRAQDWYLTTITRQGMVKPICAHRAARPLPRLSR